ncbi:MAG: cysteine-rich CWC family protein [Verrucomicrobiota bacterium]
MNSPHNPCVCPLCGQPNDCELAKQGNHEGPCWCWNEKPSEAALARIPAELRHKVCLCHDCLTGKTVWPAPNTWLVA